MSTIKYNKIWFQTNVFRQLYSTTTNVSKKETANRVDLKFSQKKERKKETFRNRSSLLSKDIRGMQQITKREKWSENYHLTFNGQKEADFLPKNFVFIHCNLFCVLVGRWIMSSKFLSKVIDKSIKNYLVLMKLRTSFNLF